MPTENNTGVKLGDLVKCSWLDAFGTAAEDYDAESIAKATAHKMITYGLLIRNDEHLIGLAAEISEGGYYRGVTFIPTSIVVSIEPVKITRKRRSPKSVPGSASLPEAK